MHGCIWREEARGFRGYEKRHQSGLICDYETLFSSDQTNLFVFYQRLTEGEICNFRQVGGEILGKIELHKRAPWQRSADQQVARVCS